MSDYYLGFDFGTTKIGVAVGQKITGTATPLGVITARDGKPDWPAVDAMVNEWKPKLMVVGLPLNMDGTTSDMSEAAEKFGRRLHGRYGLPVEMADERLSTFEAREIMEGEGGDVDAIAARLILETWFRSKTE